ncbi:methyltransferase domain-containing protein [Chelatococcus sp. GCM10030263]|uniref:methyltransferase domain-containing protein n=1 Tax=Chelatococcus sp. GCM10030263 TaxID=3273387 RepID=UPI0036118103
MADLALHSFTALDKVQDTETYIAALTQFDAIAQMQELKAIERAQVAPGATVLDVGCGFGLETLRFAAAGHPVTGLDKSADFIAEARRRAAAQGLAAAFAVADADALPYPAASFDHVRAERVLIYLEEPERAVAEMRRVARPGATLSFIEPDFGSLDVNLADRGVVRRAMAYEADTAVAQSALPGRLAGFLADLGLEVEIATRVVIFPQDLAAAYFSAIGRHAARDGALTAAEGEAWAAEVATLHARGRLFGTIGYFLSLGRV